MPDGEVKRQVISLLTAAAQAADEARAGATEMPPELLEVLRTPATKVAATLRVPAGPVSTEEMSRLLRETLDWARSAMEAHYAQVVGYMVILFMDLADEAQHVDLQAFLQRHALLAAMDDGPESV